MTKKLLTIACLTCLSAVCHAGGPAYRVFPQLNALSVNYHVLSGEISTTLYAVNHESFPIICDAVMNNNKQEKNRGRETHVEPGHTAAFTFKHRRWIESIELYLICERAKDAPPAASGQPAAGTPDSNGSEVPIEDLGSP
jgi:hypothetical protein